MRQLGLHTVCEEANCPNIGECWHHGTATFMILGDTCTRSCGYCNVTHGAPKPPDPAEPANVASAIHAMELAYVVVTSVDRDDLADCGAAHFAQTIAETRAVSRSCRIEVLIPDFKGAEAALRTVLDARPGRPQPQHRNRSADVPHGAAGWPIRSRARSCWIAPARYAPHPHQVGADGRAGRRVGRGRRRRLPTCAPWDARS